MIPSQRTPTLPYFYTLLLILAIFAVAFSRFSLLEADNDLWGHLKFGELIWQEKALPEINTFAYTTPNHPWFNHEWLTEVVFYLIYDAFDSMGLLVFKLMIGGTIVAVLCHLYRQREKNIVPLFIILMLAIPVMDRGFLCRPHLLTFLFLSFLLFILYQYFDDKKGFLLGLPPLMMVWANSHGGFLAGLGLLGAVALFEWSKGLFNRGTFDWWLPGVFILSALATLINPHGIDLQIFLYHSLSHTRDISEWGPIKFFDTNHIAYKILASLFFISLILPGRKRGWEILLITLAVVYGFKHQRHSVLAAIVMVPYLSWRLAELLRIINFSSIRITLPTHLILHALILVQAVFFIYYGALSYRSAEYKIQVILPKFPIYTVRFMKENNINGNILTPFDWGEYLIWHLPESKVSVDGRFRTAYPQEVMDQNLNFTEQKPGAMAVLNQYPTDLILVRNYYKTGEQLKNNNSWVSVHKDPIATLYTRKSDPPAGLYKRFLDKELFDNLSRISSNFP
jgi:hypothetical protein